MKAILEFTLPEESHEHQDALRGSEWKWAVDDIISYLRNETKHVDHSAEEYRILDAVRERMAEILKERGLELY
jgi:hypothetical protein